MSNEKDGDGYGGKTELIFALRGPRGRGYALQSGQSSAQSLQAPPWRACQPQDGTMTQKKL